MTSLVRTTVVLSLTVLLSACPRGIDVRLREPAQVDQLTVVIKGSEERLRGVDLISVHTCSNQRHVVLWSIARTLGNNEPVPSYIAYGQTPVAWQNNQSAIPLKAGCYEVSVVGRQGVSGGLTFVVNEAGAANVK